MTANSLRGKNMGRRVAGAGSSPALPNKSTRTRLWKRLRKLDRELGKLRDVPWSDINGITWIWGKNISKKQKLDQERKKIRLKLKGYKF